jgi:hypothetical protein
MISWTPSFVGMADGSPPDASVPAAWPALQLDGPDALHRRHHQPPSEGVSPGVQAVTDPAPATFRWRHRVLDPEEVFSQVIALEIFLVGSVRHVVLARPSDIAVGSLRPWML